MGLYIVKKFFKSLFFFLPSIDVSGIKGEKVSNDPAITDQKSTTECLMLLAQGSSKDPPQGWDRRGSLCLEGDCHMGGDNFVLKSLRSLEVSQGWTWTQR